MQSGIPYFPFDVCSGDKFMLLETEFGLKAFAVIVKLFQKIYGEFGYYCEWTKDIGALFSRQIGENGSLVSEIVKAAVRRGIFDSSLFEKYRILTSKTIQERYFSAVSRRKSVEADGRYLLIALSDFKNVNIFGENADNFKQRKEKKTKVNKTKVNESKAIASKAIANKEGSSASSLKKQSDTPPSSASSASSASSDLSPEINPDSTSDNFNIGAADIDKSDIDESDTNISDTNGADTGESDISSLLPVSAYERLKDDFGKETADEYIFRIHKYCRESGHYYRSFENAVRKWISEDKAEAANRQAQRLKIRETPSKILHSKFLPPRGKISNYTDTNEIDYAAWQEKVLNDMLSAE